MTPPERDPSVRIPNLAEVAAGAVSSLSRKALVIGVVLFVGAAVALVGVNIWPSYRDLQHFQDGTRSALAARNQELVKVAVEQAAGNTIRILGAAESAVQRLASALAAPAHPTTQPIPFERDFYPGGRYVRLLGKHDGYPDGPVTFQLPQIKLRDPSELRDLSSRWQNFSREAQALHLSHPELKWLYMGTPGGNFLVFPASPMIPAEFDPRTRPWYNGTLGAQRLSWITPYYTAGGNDFVLSVAMPLPAHSGLARSVVAVDVTMTDIVDNLLTTPFCDHCMFYLVNDKGEVLGKRGDRTQGASWKELPTQRFLSDELRESMPVETASHIAASVTGEKHAEATTALSRSPKARLLSSAKASTVVYSAPIESLGWSLVGTVPREYAGNDGDRVLQGVQRVSSDLYVLMIIVTLGIAAAFAVFLAAYLKLSREAIQKSLGPALNQFADLETALTQLKIEEQAGGALTTERSLTREHASVVGSIQAMQTRLAEEAKDRERKAVYVRLAELGGELSHSIRNALQTIRNSCGGIERPTPDAVGTIRTSVTRIEEELERFRSSYRAASNGATIPDQPSQPRLVLIDKLVRDIASEHEVCLPKHVQLVLEGLAKVPAVWAFVRPADFRAALGNIIQNGIEAMEGQSCGTLTIVFAANPETIRISVRDTGRGISADLLPRVFEKNFTHGKPKGTGLGLHQAKQAIEWIEGTIEAESALGAGSAFTIQLLRHAEPSWLARSITLPPGKSLAVIDDDPSMLDFWKERLEEVGVSARYFRSLSEASEHDLSEHVVVLDQQFEGDPTTGLSWLSNLARRPTTYLCTAAYEESEVQARVEQMGLKMIPKAAIAAVAVERAHG